MNGVYTEFQTNSREVEASPNTVVRGTLKSFQTNSREVEATTDGEGRLSESTSFRRTLVRLKRSPLGGSAARLAVSDELS